LTKSGGVCEHGSHVGINRADRSDPAGFIHSFDQRTWAHELAENIRLQSAFESRGGDRPLQARDWGRLAFKTHVASEVKIAVKALKRMLELGRPIRVRIA
jgi:hypothetical protein